MTSLPYTETAAGPVFATRSSPPAWLFSATALLALACLVMAVAETTLWTHYLIDAGESLSLYGLAFILVAGLFLYRRERLFVSLPLVFPWLIYPVITQGDQAIDNLSINQMRLITHLLLSALFAMPVAVVVLAARHALAPRHTDSARASKWIRFTPGLREIALGRVDAGVARLAAMLFALEIWVADRYLGTLMMLTLAVMILAALGYPLIRPSLRRPRRSETLALALLLIGIGSSLTLFIALKNRPGAYQGSPSHFMDASAGTSAYPLNRVTVPPTPPRMPETAGPVREVLTVHGRALERLLAGYYVLDRNYNYHFHNELFLRRTPLLSDYRAVGLAEIAAGRDLHDAGNTLAASLGSMLTPSDPLQALLEDVREFVGFQFERASVLERMSAEFQKTKAGLQHATHLYEGEGKFLGITLAKLVQKHHRVLRGGEVSVVTAEFRRIAESVSTAYTNRIVGF